MEGSVNEQCGVIAEVHRSKADINFPILGKLHYI